MNKLVRYLIAVFILFMVPEIGFCEVSVLTPVEGITFKPGFRIQPRYSYDNGANDMMMRRTRLKAEGDAFGKVKYKFEWKLDNVGQEGKTANVIAETVFIAYLFNPALNISVGLYDAPFSRDALTSDSKLLLMDYSLIYDKLKEFGITDNTYGLLLYGRPYEGFMEYSIGVFDSNIFDKESKELMWGGRCVINLLDGPKVDYADYRGSYIGEGRRLNIGVNYERLGNIISGGKQFDLSAWGLDIFGNYKPFTMQAEYGRFKKDIEGDGWYVQGGYLMPLEYSGTKIEVAFRYQSIDPNTNISMDKLRWTTIGFNFYIKGHNLKIQTDYTFKEEEGQGVDNDTFMVQGQLDF